MTICTIDVHSRDVVSKMILNKIESSFAFSWQSQLRHRLVKAKQTSLSAQVGRGRGGLLCKHLRRGVPVLARVPREHAETGHHTAHWQVGPSQLLVLQLQWIRKFYNSMGFKCMFWDLLITWSVHDIHKQNSKLWMIRTKVKVCTCIWFMEKATKIHQAWFCLILAV